jgi:hypothetical protein
MDERKDFQSMTHSLIALQLTLTELGGVANFCFRYASIVFSGSRHLSRGGKARHLMSDVRTTIEETM